MADLWSDYQSLLSDYPLSTQMVTSAVLALVGDLVAQVVIEKRSLRHCDLLRCASFVAVSTFWVAPIASPWLAFLGSRVGTSLSPSLAPLLRTAVDQSVMAPCMISSVLVWLRLLEGNGLRKSLLRWRQDFVEVFRNGLKIWPPAMLINFYLVPPIFRVVFVQCVALVWNTYLSWRANLTNGEVLVK